MEQGKLLSKTLLFCLVLIFGCFSQADASDGNSLLLGLNPECPYELS